MPSSEHVFLALSCLALLGVIAAQDWLYIPLRNETISSGLTGPFHWWLDAAYVPLSVAVAMNFHGLPGAIGAVQGALAIIAALSLLLVAATNTAWRFFDGITDGQHSLWHSRFTEIVFASVIALEVVSDHGWRWGMTALNVAIPVAAYLYFRYRPTTIKGVTIAASPAAEKLLVLGMTLWLIAL